MKKGLLVVGGIIGFFAIIFLVIIQQYNSLISAEEGVSSAWSQVENVYQRRLDLIPNLVSTVKGYAAHEKKTLQDVVEARSKVSQMKFPNEALTNEKYIEQFQKNQAALSSALSRLMVVVERYPDLKASQNFLTLQSQLEGSENRIAVERRRYNEAAKRFNILRRRFPTSLLANYFGFTEKVYFKAEEKAKTVPKVEF